MPGSEPHAIEAAIVGQSIGRSTVAISARRVMAYSAGIGAVREAYFGDVPVASPAFVVALEWPLLNGATYRELLKAPQPVMERAVHLTQASEFFGPIAAGTVLTTTGRIVALRQARRGVIVSVALETEDAAGQRLAMSRFVALILDAQLQGDVPAPLRDPLPAELASVGEVVSLPVPAGAAHVYSECSGIWNPLHTELPAARRAGFEQPIVHGTWSWVTTMEWAIDRWCNGDPARLRSWTGRFVAPVLPGAPLDIRAEWHGDTIAIEAVQLGVRCLVASGEVVPG